MATKPCNRNGYGVLCISDKASKTRKFAKKSAKLFLSASKFAGPVKIYAQNCLQAPAE